ncbi:peptidoglycan-binding domain-containing protein [Streptomyces sp. NPDC050732]|uniref:peptidoglycan-binding domain-containing protein n=1 Tax=Streptomyces sp. NPDC050732 TaxID=3154632 RepID=UPI003418A0D8
MRRTRRGRRPTVWLEQDSDFGPATLRGVRWLQSCARIEVDGDVGRDTWRALRTSSC